jgi:hypothetical protein
MLKELKEYFRRKKGLPNRMEEVETIDYSYVRAKHIKSVNALARQFFWPGIDCMYLCLFNYNFKSCNIYLFNFNI